jgi:hypothetical protein
VKGRSKAHCPSRKTHPPNQRQAPYPPSVLANKPTHSLLSSPHYFFALQKITADKWQLISSHYFEVIILKQETMLPRKSAIRHSHTKLALPQIGEANLHYIETDQISFPWNYSSLLSGNLQR